MKTALDVLRQARSELLQRGWAQGCIQDETGAVCLVGAMRCATGCSNPYEFVWTPAYDSAHEAVAEAVDARPRRASTVPFFNDHRSTTFADVLSVLDDAIEAEAAAWA